MGAGRLIIRWLIVSGVMFVGYAIASVAVPIDHPEMPSDSSSALPLTAVCLLNSAVLVHLAVRARFGGMRLVGMLFVVFFGVTTFMSQIESAFFLDHAMPEGTVSRIVAMGAIVSIIIAPSTAWVFGRLRHDDKGEGTHIGRLPRPPAEWAWKVGVISLLYLVLYFSFGYFVAWTNPELRNYYGGAEPAGFVVHMLNIATDSPQLLVFQIVRSWAWTLLALVILVQNRNGWLEAALSVGFAFAVLMNAQLLIPNPFMPEGVRMTHLVETSISNFLFGFGLVWILLRFDPRRSQAA